MKKKTLTVAVLASCITLSATLGGCSLVSKNSMADMAQEIATVDIRNSDVFGDSGLEAYKDAITVSSIEKRDLVSYFINVGSTYVTQYGYSYADTFNMLLDSLIDNAVLTQYATLYLIGEKSKTEPNALETFKSKTTEVEKYKYLLDDDDVEYATYKLYSSLNSAIDSYEKKVIEEEDGYTGTDKRTTPTNLNTEQDDYYPVKDGKLDYNVYTGFEGYLIGQSGKYQEDKLDGTTRVTRIKAYNAFLDNLRANDLIGDGESEVLTDVLKLGYIQSEFVSQLESRVVNKYYELYEEQRETLLTDNNYEYTADVYGKMLGDQKKSYKTSSAFDTAMGSMSSTSFILFNPETGESDWADYDGKNLAKFGYVYNILLPYNAKQSAQLAELTKIKEANKDDNSYYFERNELLRNIKTEDQRSAWFNGEKNYSFNAKAEESKYTADYYGKNSGRDYLFFEGHLADSAEGGRYKKLQAYDGRYSYNGSAYENDNGSYTLIGNELTIDGMLKEFSAYINYVLGGDYVEFDNKYTPEQGNTAYYNQTDFYKDADKKEIDYSKFLYASGKVKFGEFKKSDLMNSKTKQYEAMSAVNELQFAYTTDTGVLSQYVGYSVSAYNTSYIKEFEYAAKLAVASGEGSFTVCAGDYGWHLIYVTYAFDFGTDGVVYTPDWANNVGVEGTFENLFYEWLKSTDLADVTTNRRDKIISDFGKETGDHITVVKYQSRYQNLLDLGD